MIIEFTQLQLELKIQIPQKIMKGICTSISKHYPNEFGGVLFGEYSPEMRIVKIVEAISPKTFMSSPVKFTRNATQLNFEIKEKFKKSAGQVLYVGEWHSHPDGSSEFSKLDLQSMQEISSDDNVMISTPILLIVGYSKDTYNASFYVLNNNNLLKYEPTYIS